MSRTNEQKNQHIQTMLAIMEAMNGVNEIFTDAQTLNLDDINPVMWQILQESMVHSLAMLEMFKMSLQNVGKFIDNDLLMDHMEAVVASEL